MRAAVSHRLHQGALENPPGGRRESGLTGLHVSVVLPTYNRSDALRSALEKLLVQNVRGIEYEIVVVDNNSTDNTREMIASFEAKEPRLRYVFERRQGVSYARNAGIHAARSNLLVFCDDDVEVQPQWIQQNYDAALRYPEAAYIGARILPVWNASPPAWTQWSMAPFAVSDHGVEPMTVSPKNQQCLITASLAVPRSTFERAGLFDVETQKVKKSPCSTEDYEWERKVWAHGGYGMYVPDIVCYTPIPKDRIRKSYHRRWHICHGKLNAISRSSEYESARSFLGVALFAYRLGIQAACDRIRYAFRSDGKAFYAETQMCFLFGFMRQRWKDYFLKPETRKSPSSAPGRSA
jgi:glucosyl-dolichyl phosphate glucuronosyltransferase